MAVSVIIGSVMLIMLGPYSATVDSPLRGALMFRHVHSRALLLRDRAADPLVPRTEMVPRRIPCSGLAINALSQDFDAARAAG